MFNVLEYSRVRPYGYCLSTISYGQEKSTLNSSPVYRWLLTGKIPESPTITPTNVTQVITPSGVNRTLQTVTVKGKFPATYQVTVEVGKTASVGLDGAATATPETVATATATVANDIVTVTGVAAGITTVRIYDAAGTLIGIVITTVKAA